MFVWHVCNNNMPEQYNDMNQYKTIQNPWWVELGKSEVTVKVFKTPNSIMLDHDVMNPVSVVSK